MGGNLSTKTLVIGGEDDYPSFASEAKHAARIFPNAETFLIPGVGHNPHEEVPEIISSELIRFLKH